MLTKPSPLRSGDLIGVISPAAAVDETQLNNGIRVLEGAGFRVRLGAASKKRTGYLAGSDRERLTDLYAMLRDPEVKAIIAARGGYGSGRLLPSLDLDAVRANPKIIVGHSDISFLLNHFLQQCELVTFHGPMITNLPVQPDGATTLLKMLGGEPFGWYEVAPEIIQPGMAEGPLAGGCLSVVVAALGTPYAVPTRGRLLFLEDVNEKPFRIDRMLTQMRQAGALDAVAGVVFGEMTGCTAGEGERVSVRDVINEAFANVTYPVVFGFPSGHGAGTFTLPFGVRARLAAERLTLLESPTL
ncbi:MAG TPA: LD-carboxypeptidase [Candidatus Acidoferrales bacterium]|nr:LD-carboxypeptidase [Candidatus Acidoferrales bacterium]